VIHRTLISSFALILAAGPAFSEVSSETVQSLSAPSAVETRAGKLDFRDGVPTEETAQKIYDTLDFTRALNVYNNSFRGASALAIVKGFEEIGAKPGDVVIFSQLMDSASLFRRNDDLFQPHTAERRGSRQLDRDRPEQGLVYDPPPLQPSPIVLRQELAPERNRVG